jgi:soluble lytic murein transglycosylase-like protein
MASAPAFGQTTSTDMRVLSEDDVHRYRVILEDERAGRFDDAEAQFANLNDTSLKGYMLAEHYLSPHGKRVPVQDLVAWLHEYSELPPADRIYDLAVKRSTKKVRHHHHTILVAIVTDIPAPRPAARRRGGGYEDVDLPEGGYESDAARAALPQIEQYVKVDQPDQANAVLQSLAGRATPVDIARLTHRVAASYLAEGMDQQAYALASDVEPVSKHAVPLLYWDAGLAAYRINKFHEAGQQFEELAQAGAVPNWTRSAAAFWAARSHLQDGDAQDYITLLQVAAKSEPTFYGLIAERVLGQDTETGFSDPVVTAQDFQAVVQDPAAHRAVALWQIGDREDAAEELNRAFGESDGNHDPVFVALADKMNAANLELRASETSASRGVMLNGLFPVPDYHPDGGYRIDPSLVLAFARIESRFQPGVTSPAGARGLMQLMPGTAVHIAGPGAAERLTDPSYNLTLGQRYIEELLAQLNGNLFELAAAYNAGPGALTRWMGAKSDKMGDPLLFIESMPVPETRAYVKRMMTYHWMYRRRMGRDAKSLDETAQGGWPLYRPADMPSPVLTPPATSQPTVVNQQISDARPTP